MRDYEVMCLSQGAEKMKTKNLLLVRNCIRQHYLLLVNHSGVAELQHHHGRVIITIDICIGQMKLNGTNQSEGVGPNDGVITKLAMATPDASAEGETGIYLRRPGHQKE